MDRSLMTAFVRRILSILAVTGALALATSSAQAQPGWSVGLRGEYIAVGGDQFATLSGGYGASGFLRRQIGEVGSLEVGGRLSRHRMWVVCFSPDCIRYVHRKFTEGYIRPGIHLRLPGTSIMLYTGGHIGVLAGEFQDESPGVSVGGVGGFGIPLGHRLVIEMGLTGTVVYVGTDLPRSGWGRQLNLQLGFAVR